MKIIKTTRREAKRFPIAKDEKEKEKEVRRKAIQYQIDYFNEILLNPHKGDKDMAQLMLSTYEEQMRKLERE